MWLLPDKHWMQLQSYEYGYLHNGLHYVNWLELALKRLPLDSDPGVRLMNIM